MKNLTSITARIIITATLVFGFFNPASAQPERERINAAFEFLMSGTQKLTKSEYDAFWKMMPQMSPSEKAKLIETFKPDIADGLEYQRNLWVCARTAWVSARTPNCDDAFRVFDRMIKRAKAQGISTDAMMDSLENSKRLLSSAASHGVLKSYDGRETPLSLQLINTTINSLDVKFSRVRDGLK